MNPAFGIERIETAQMVLERLQPAHGEELCRLLLDPAVLRTTWPFAEPPTREEMLRRNLEKVEHWERHGFGLWLARDRATAQMIGRGGLQYTYAPGLNAVEVAWAIVPERWRQGLATELAQAALDAAFGPMRLLDVVALTLPDNVASRRVMEKAGFRYERDIEQAGVPHVLYRRTRPAAAEGAGTLRQVGPFNPVP